MSRDGLFLQGFAAPFGSIGYVENGREKHLEMFEPLAFDLAGCRVDLRCGHDGRPFASTSDRTLRLDQNEYGLRFEAALPASCDIYGWLSQMRRGELGASVSMPSLIENVHYRRSATATGEPLHSIRKTKIDHIALHTNPAYPETSCWVSSWDPADMPPRLRAALDRWTVAPVVTDVMPRPHARAARMASGPGVQGHLSQLRALVNRPGALADLSAYYRKHNSDPDLQSADRILSSELKAASKR